MVLWGQFLWQNEKPCSEWLHLDRGLSQPCSKNLNMKPFLCRLQKTYPTSRWKHSWTFGILTAPTFLFFFLSSQGEALSMLSGFCLPQDLTIWWEEVLLPPPRPVPSTDSSFTCREQRGTLSCRCRDGVLDGKLLKPAQSVCAAF